MRAPGGMISFVVKGGLEKADRVLCNTQIFALAESLGGVESLIEHPAIMTHASVPPETRAELEFDDGLLRLSVGIEDIEDLFARSQKSAFGIKGKAFKAFPSPTFYAARRSSASLP